MTQREKISTDSNPGLPLSKRTLYHLATRRFDSEGGSVRLQLLLERVVSFVVVCTE